jgi:hypothetical protein
MLHDYSSSSSSLFNRSMDFIKCNGYSKFMFASKIKSSQLVLSKYNILEHKIMQRILYLLELIMRNWDYFYWCLLWFSLLTNLFNIYFYSCNFILLWDPYVPNLHFSALILEKNVRCAVDKKWHVIYNMVGFYKHFSDPQYHKHPTEQLI